MSRGMVIVGNGECGTRAALGLRAEGYVGPITLIGEERHLPYERPPLSKNIVDCSKGDRIFKPLITTAQLSQNSIDTIFHCHVEAIDLRLRTVTLSGGATVGYDKLLLATGAVPRRLGVTDGMSRAFYLRTWDDAQALSRSLETAKHIVVIGAGFIGLEVAANAARASIAVTVIEAQERILKRALPQDISSVLHALHEREGVRLHVGSAVESLEETADGVIVRLAGKPPIEADLMVVGIGAVPRTELAEKAGLQVDNGIVVDETLRTSDAHVFAAGDCCLFPSSFGGKPQRLEAWRNAVEQGALVAKNMLGKAQRHSGVPWFWSDHYDFSIQMTGSAEGSATTVRRDLRDSGFILFHLAEDMRITGACGFGLGQMVARDIKMAEQLIASAVPVSGEALASKDVSLRTLVREAAAAA